MRPLVVILGLFIVVSFLTIPRDALQNDDASTYALAAKNMVVHGQWLGPLVTPGDLSSFNDKPPLGLWLLAWFPKLCGVSELTVHVPNVIYFTLVLALLYFSLAGLSSKKTALYSTLIAATSLCLVVYSRAPKLDVPLVLFLLTAHLALYGWLKKGNTSYLILVAFSLACGFLVKTGFGVVPPLLTALFLFIFNARARERFLSLVPRPSHLVPAIALFALIVGSVLFSQSFALHDQWLPYLKSITVTSKYSTGYLGFGFYYSIVGFLLVAVFPWTPLALAGIKWRNFGRKLNLNTFCSLWFWSNFLFLLFFYKLTDLRTFVALVPPLAILAAIKLIGWFRKPATERRGFLIGFQLLFFILFAVALAALLIKPVNPQGFSLVYAIWPVAFFTLSLALLAFLFLKPSKPFLALCFAFIALSYSILFYNTKPLVEAFNPDVKWPALIREYKEKGFSFYIYRPHDRNLFYSPDLCYVDFMAGPADKYFWEPDDLRKALKRGNTIVLSDSASWQKLGLKLPVLAKDDYSLLAGTRY